MHSAPAVSYPVGRSRFHGWLLAGLSGCVVVVLMVWLSQTQVLSVRHVGAVLLGLVGVGLAVYGWWRSPVGVLAWDGSGWHLSRSGVSESVVPEVSLDLQAHLLLYLRRATTRPGIWVWADHQASPQRWRAFRRALFAKLPLADQQNKDGGLVATQDASVKAQS